MARTHARACVVRRVDFATMPKTSLTDYIKLYDNALSPETCNALIDRFEASSAQHKLMRYNVGEPNGYSYVQLNVSEHWPDVVPTIGSILQMCLLRYRDSLDLGRFWPDKPESEAIRMKRY